MVETIQAPIGSVGVKKTFILTHIIFFQNNKNDSLVKSQFGMARGIGDVREIVTFLKKVTI